MRLTEKDAGHLCLGVTLETLSSHLCDRGAGPTRTFQPSRRDAILPLHEDEYNSPLNGGMPVSDSAPGRVFY